MKKLNGTLADRENALEQQRLEQQEQNCASEQKLQNAIERLTASLNHKDQQLQVHTQTHTQIAHLAPLPSLTPDCFNRTI